MKHPLGLVVLLYVGGLLLAEFCRPPVIALFEVSLAVVALTLFVPSLRRFLILPLILLTAWANLISRTAVVSPNDLRTLIGSDPAEVRLRGVLLATPIEHTIIRDGVAYQHTLAPMDVTEMRFIRGTNWQPAFGRVMTFSHGASPGFFVGQKVEVRGVLAPPGLPLAEGLFDYRKYLERRGIYYELNVALTNDWAAILPRQPPSLSDRFLTWARATLSRDLPVKDDPLNLLCSMTLGWQADITNEIYLPFMQSGTMHIFAISGLHIALIAAVLIGALRLVRVPRFWCGLIAIPLVWFYTAATGWQPSAVRSVIMMTVIVGGWTLDRPTNLINSLAVAALIILGWEPQQLFEASFQLSFFVMLSIALSLPPLENLRDRLLQTDPLRPVQLLPRWQRWLQTPIRYLATAVVTSLAAWLGSWPFTAYYFHLFSPVTLLANLLVVPLSSFALACNVASLICGDLLPWPGALFNHCAWLFMAITVWISHRFSSLPGAFFHTAPPNLADFAIYYTVLFAVLTGWVFQAKRRGWVIFGLVAIGAFYGWRWHAARNSVQITAIPLNGGSCVFDNGPGQASELLVDCGDTNLVDSATKPFLWAQGVDHLPHFLLTHGSKRHIGGAEDLDAAIPAREIATGPAGALSQVYRRTLAYLEQHRERWRTVSESNELAGWTVLYPAVTDRFKQADDNCVTLLGEFYGTLVLLLSDLGQSGQNALIERQPNLRADIVVACLPDQAEPVCDDLLDLIQPKLIIITDSEFPVIKRASENLHERLEARKTPVFYTRATQAVTLTFTRSGWEARGMDGQSIKVASTLH